MLKYNWMSQDANVKLVPINEPKTWLVMLEQPGQDYCMGSVKWDEKIERYVARAKGRKFPAMCRQDAVARLMDFMHSEAMAAKMALQTVVVDNILDEN